MDNSVEKVVLEEVTNNFSIISANSPGIVPHFFWISSAVVFIWCSYCFCTSFFIFSGSDGMDGFVADNFDNSSEAVAVSDDADF